MAQSQQLFDHFQASARFVFLLLVIILHAAQLSSSLSIKNLKYAGTEPERDVFEKPSFGKESSAKVLADVVNYMKLNRPGAEDRVHLSKAEVRELVERIRSSEYLDELRNLSKIWHEQYPVKTPSRLPWVDPDVYYNMSGLVWSKGYPIEEYKVVTEDGYILGLFRIPHGRRQSNSTGSRPAVFLQHGLLAASTTWVENLANQSLGFILADAGFDVWMGNMRGNTYSRNHVSLDPNQLAFWQFTWDQMAKYDLPAMVNFALAKSGQSQLAYVGHSQGTLVAFTGFSMNPQLGKKISSISALGPIYTIADVDIIYQDLIHSGLAGLLADILTLAGVDEFLPRNFWTNEVAAQTLCAWPETAFICEYTIMFFGGYSVHHMNLSRVQVYISNEPAGSSLLNMDHYIQMVESGKCRMYDYGVLGNLKHYNQTTPPEYHIEDLAVPVALFWGVNDRLADPTDVKRLIPRIPHLIYNKRIEDFEHLDFIWAMDAKSILYDDIISIIRGKIPPH